jgi:hypothetical protein
MITLEDRQERLKDRRVQDTEDLLEAVFDCCSRREYPVEALFN